MVNFVTVRIDDRKCTRCYTCVDECSTGALSLEGVIFCHNAYECSYCESCMMVCQNDAIKILDM